VTDLPNLETTLLELQTAEEELQAQNEELRAAQAALERQRRRYAELFEVAPDSLFVTDVAGRIVEANSAALRMLEVSPDDVAGREMVRFLPPSAREAFRTALAALAAGEPIVERDLRLRGRTGGERIVHARAVPIVDSAGETVELRWALRDVTDQRAAAAELRLLNVELEERVGERTAALERQRALVEAVLEQNPLGIAIVDESEQVVLANTEAKRMLGVAGPPFEAKGYRLDGSAYADGEWPVLRSLRAGEVVMGERGRIVRPDGEQAIVEINSGPIRDGERVIAAVSVFRDVTLAEQHAQAEREFVSNAAHELRTPLAAIIGAVEVLQAGAKHEPEERERFLAHVEQQCRRLGRLTDALLTLARVETHAEPPRLEIIELRPLLEEVAQTMHGAPRVSVEVDCPEEIAVVASPELLEEALLNLASNAVKYTSRGTVTLSAVELQPGFVEVAVRDTGRGMSKRETERAAERFYRGDEGAKDGFGLGLAIVAAAARAMGSEVRIESASGRGTTVRMTLRAGRLVTA
jgi:PAS domain S-box-containing protein